MGMADDHRQAGNRGRLAPWWPFRPLVADRRDLLYPDPMSHQQKRKPPSAGQGKRGPDGHLAYLLRQANAAVRLRLERALGDLGATLPQFLVMTMLKAYPGISGAELSRVALLTPQTMGVITHNLVRMGAVEKRPHPTHGRVIELSLTPAGDALLEQCKACTDGVEGGLTRGLSGEDEAVVRRWLASLASGIEPGAGQPDVL